MIIVAVSGYGTIGKRVANAVAAQPHMKLNGVSKTKPSHEAFVAISRGYPLYIADISKRAAYKKAGLPVAGSVGEMLKAADIIVDATPGGVGAKSKLKDENMGIKAIWQGGEEHEVAGFSFNSDCNYREAIGQQFARGISWITTGLCRIINTMDKAYGVEKVRAVMVRRGGDPVDIKRGPIDAIVLNPVHIPSHHGPDVQSVLPNINIVTLAMIVPVTMMHMHVVQMDLKRAAEREKVIEIIEKHPRKGIVQKRESNSEKAMIEILPLVVLGGFGALYGTIALCILLVKIGYPEIAASVITAVALSLTAVIGQLKKN